jgi:predicted DsbA family dithiol-disulfide isomerase
LRLAPYQLYPEFSTEGVSRYEWYKAEKYNDSAERMQMYIDYVTTLGKDNGIEFDFKEGAIANTFHAHRVLQHLQNHYSPEAAILALWSLYKSYFSEGQHPSSSSTLVKAYLAAGIDEDRAKRIVQDEEIEARKTKESIQEQVGNAVDSVPHVVFEGRRRVFTLVGAKGVGEYEKVLEQVVKEAV